MSSAVWKIIDCEPYEPTEITLAGALVHSAQELEAMLRMLVFMGPRVVDIVTDFGPALDVCIGGGWMCVRVRKWGPSHEDFVYLPNPPTATEAMGFIFSGLQHTVHPRALIPARLGLDLISQIYTTHALPQGFARDVGQSVRSII